LKITLTKQFDIIWAAEMIYDLEIK